MLNRDILTREHDEIDALAVHLLAQVARLDAPADDIAAARWKLTRLLLAHLAKEDRLLYPAMKKDADRKLAGMATRFADEMGGLAADYSGYVSQWNIDAMCRDWKAFQAETRRVLTALRRRIARENSELYPLMKD